MTTTVHRRLAALALAAPLLLGACSSDDDQTLPDIDTGQVPQQEQPTDVSSLPNVTGTLVSASPESLVLRLPDGTDRTFQVRPEDAQTLGMDHLASHAGIASIGFQVFYATEGGSDYAVAAYETAPPT